jgi:aspartokinase-like uncharacterized kinase
MALGAAELGEIETLLAAPVGTGVAVTAALRRRFPALTVTVCDESDIDAETPFRALPGALLYLVDNADHCWRLTADPARATGLVVARRKASAS